VSLSLAVECQVGCFRHYSRVDPGQEALPIIVWRVVLPLRVVEVSGPSMVPTLRHGDVVVARRLGRRSSPAAGDVVLGRFRTMPDRLVVKRTVRAVDGGWWLASDNTFAGGDSEVHGVADVEARVLMLWRGRRPRIVR
jgi:peptidase S24-like protein